MKKQNKEFYRYWYTVKVNGYIVSDRELKTEELSQELNKSVPMALPDAYKIVSTVDTLPQERL